MIWFRRAAEQGNAIARDDIGTMYYNRQGVPKDYVRAYMWFDLSADNGFATAAKSREIVAKKLTPTQIAQA